MEYFILGLVFAVWFVGIVLAFKQLAVFLFHWNMKRIRRNRRNAPTPLDSWSVKYWEDKS